MDFEALVIWLRDNWATIVATGVILAPIEWKMISGLYRHRLAETQARALEPGYTDEPGWRCLPSMAEAISEAVQTGALRLRVLCYAGNYLRRTLENAPKPRLEGMRVQVLTREPDGDWLHPRKGTAQHASRGRDIRKLIEALEHAGHFSGLSHHGFPGGSERFVRFYDSEPFIRIVVAEFKDGARHMAIGMYHLDERLEGVMDFTGTDGEVVRLRDAPGDRRGVISDFVQWFDFQWELRAGAKP